MPVWTDGIRYLPGGSPEWYYDKAGNPAPEEAVVIWTRKRAVRLGIKPAGRHAMAAGQTIDELRLAELERGASEEQLADREGIDIESLKKSLRRGRQRRSRATG